eukprot:9035544-Alexandrium_andersonii.AAC.1
MSLRLALCIQAPCPPCRVEEACGGVLAVRVLIRLEARVADGDAASIADGVLPGEALTRVEAETLTRVALAQLALQEWP